MTVWICYCHLRHIGPLVRYPRPPPTQSNLCFGEQLMNLKTHNYLWFRISFVWVCLKCGNHWQSNYSGINVSISSSKGVSLLAPPGSFIHFRPLLQRVFLSDGRCGNLHMKGGDSLPSLWCRFSLTKGCKKEQVMQYLGFCTAGSIHRPTRTENQLFRNPNFA